LRIESPIQHGFRGSIRHEIISLRGGSQERWAIGGRATLFATPRGLTVNLGLKRAAFNVGNEASRSAIGGPLQAASRRDRELSATQGEATGTERTQ